MAARPGVTAPRTSGRPLVRRISRSMSRSAYWLMAFAPPAASIPPSSVLATSALSGHPPAATTIAGTVVISSSQMIRGFVRAM